MSARPGRNKTPEPKQPRPGLRFWIRGLKTRGGSLRKWSLYDAATGEYFGSEFTDKELVTLEQHLRMVRSKHNESINSAMFWDGGPI
jgi:hypothetical protein